MLVPGASTPNRDVRPVVTPNQLTMYFGSPSTRADLDIWITERKALTDPFGAPVLVDAASTQGEDFPSWISPDGCRLYFDAGITKRDLFVAERVH